MDKEKWKQITMNTAFLTCIGCVHYKDIFGKSHKTVFCWKYEHILAFIMTKTPNAITKHKITTKLFCPIPLLQAIPSCVKKCIIAFSKGGEH